MARCDGLMKASISNKTAVISMIGRSPCRNDAAHSRVYGMDPPRVHGMPSAERRAHPVSTCQRTALQDTAIFAWPVQTLPLATHSRAAAPMLDPCICRHA